MKTIATFLFLTALVSCLAESAPSVPTALNIGSRRELFVDDYLVASLDGAAFKVHQPQPQEIVFTTDAPWEGNRSRSSQPDAGDASRCGFRICEASQYFARPWGVVALKGLPAAVYFSSMNVYAIAWFPTVLFAIGLAANLLLVGALISDGLHAVKRFRARLLRQRQNQSGGRIGAEMRCGNL
jgi:hypothetical protein